MEQMGTPTQTADPQMFTFPDGAKVHQLLLTRQSLVASAATLLGSLPRMGLLQLRLLRTKSVLIWTQKLSAKKRE